VSSRELRGEEAEMDIKGLRSAKLRDAETMLACLVKVDGTRFELSRLPHRREGV
jgi:hypothetical protein